MKNRRQTVVVLLAACTMLIIILDTKTALNSARDGLQLCMRTVFPSLFPYFVLSGMINGSLIGREIPFLRPICRLCNIPVGAESITLLGFLGGYPVGAQLITQTHRDHSITDTAAKRMLGFSSNAGPAFLFGMLSPAFDDPTAIWFLWGIHILSALFVGAILPGREKNTCSIQRGHPITMAACIQNAIRNIVNVCAWVILFRLILGFCHRWFLWLFPVELQILFSGFLELSNGCVSLYQLPLSGARFIMTSIMLSFGGLCVLMQTHTVTQKLGMGWYFPGKIIQTIVSFILSVILQSLLFDKSQCLSVHPVLFASAVILLLVILYGCYRKKVVAFGRKVMYNTDNQSVKESRHAVS